MTIPFEKLETRLFANPKVKAEYDVLAPELEIAAELLRGRVRAGPFSSRVGSSDGHQPIHDRPARKWSSVAEHQATLALCRRDRRQVPRAAIGGLGRRAAFFRQQSSGYGAELKSTGDRSENRRSVMAITSVV
jgi:hypothetical protein